MSVDTDFALSLLRDQIKAKLDERKAKQAERDAGQTEIDAIVGKATDEKRNLSDAETHALNERVAAVRSVDTQLADIDSDLDGLNQRKSLVAESRAAQDAARAAAQRWAAQADSADTVDAPARVKSEPRTYTRGAEVRGVSFFRDIAASFMSRDPEAGMRLERHQKEARLEELAGYEARDVGTGAFAGLTVPQYLTDLAAPSAKAWRPTVEICNHHPLPPSGMSLNISRITTGSATAVQASENAGVQETDMDDTLLTVNVRTYAGSQDVSRQAIERGSGVDSIVIDDLTRDYWTKVDAAILNSDGTGGTHLGIRNVASISASTYTDASPTAAELYPKLADLIQQAQAAAFLGLTHFVMHPRRWWWLASQVGSTFPFLTVPSAGVQQAGNIGGTDYMGTNRNIMGIPVVIDGNMLTNLGAGTEDVIIGVTAPELHFWDDGVQFIRAEQPLAQNLAVRFVLYGYSAFTAGRYPGAQGVISGTGLIAPTF